MPVRIERARMDTGLRFCAMHFGKRQRIHQLLKMFSKNDAPVRSFITFQQNTSNAVYKMQISARPNSGRPPKLDASFKTVSKIDELAEASRNASHRT